MFTKGVEELGGTYVIHDFSNYLVVHHAPILPGDAPTGKET